MSASENSEQKMQVISIKEEDFIPHSRRMTSMDQIHSIAINADQQFTGNEYQEKRDQQNELG